MYVMQVKVLLMKERGLSQAGGLYLYFGDNCRGYKLPEDQTIGLTW